MYIIPHTRCRCAATSAPRSGDQSENALAVQMLVNPKAVCVDAEGRLLVVESHVRRLHLFDWYSERARPINRLELGETLDFPVHLAVNNRLGRIYIADHNAHAIKAFDYSGAARLGSLHILYSVQCTRCGCADCAVRRA